jgi:hypothetical protein
MFKFLKNIFQCQHYKINEGTKWATRFGKPIIIEYRECKDCNKILRCQVSFQEEIVPVKPTRAKKPTPVAIAEPLPAPIKEKAIVEAVPSPIIGTLPPKELVFQGLKPQETPAPTSLIEAEQAEVILEASETSSPFQDTPETPIPEAKGIAEAIEENEEPQDPHKEAMIEGGCFLKEAHASINQRRKALARRRARALENLKKKGKAVVEVQKQPGIPFLDEPERPSKEDEYA